MSVHSNSFQQCSRYPEPVISLPNTEREKAVFCLKASMGMLALAAAASLVALMVVHYRSPALMQGVKASLMAAPALPVFLFGADRVVSALTVPEK